MKCAMTACSNPAYTIWRGFALCKRCYEWSLEFPNEKAMEEIEEEISMQLDEEQATGLETPNGGEESKP